jgi:hypothetical protein
LVVLAAAGVTAVAAAERTSADESMIARIMALAEVDLQFRQAELGLIGSTLGRTQEDVRAEARVSEVAHVRGVAPPAVPAPTAPASKTVRAPAGVSER